LSRPFFSIPIGSDLALRADVQANGATQKACPSEACRGILKLQCRVRLSVPRNMYRSVGYCVDQEETVVNPNGFPVRTVLMSKAL
jgi:hypothetical protein